MPFGSKRISKMRIFPNGRVEPTARYSSDPFTGECTTTIDDGYTVLPPPETMELKTLLRNKVDLKSVGTTIGGLASVDPLKGLSMDPVKECEPEPWDEGADNNSKNSKKDN